ncbi:MAG: PhoX family phosphatase [Bdellovibrionales bacterium]
MNRRGFLEFLGRTSAVGLAASQFSLPAWAARLYVPRFHGIAPSSADELIVAPGLTTQTLIQWDQALDALGQLKFGFNNDFTAFFPLTSRPDQGVLWVNHEYANALFIHGNQDPKTKTRAQVDAEMKSVGGSLVHIQRFQSQWHVVHDSPYNRRLDAFTPIPLQWFEPIDGQTMAQGTLANCAGGVTPWGTVLSCEENYQSAFGEYVYENGTRRREFGAYVEGWHQYYSRSPEAYGWVTEINPFTGQAKKLVGLGRFAHEGATPVRAPDGRCVVYMGDDAAGECIYKFISHSTDSLNEGELFVADTFSGRWLSLDLRKNRKLEQDFRSQTEIQIRTRHAARLVGGTPQDRPEDIKIDPLTGNVIVALTNNKKTGNAYGSLLKIEEENGDPRAERFQASVFLTGGSESGFSCPDNLVFDAKGNLFITSDISSGSLGKGEYAKFKNNGLFVVPASGPQRGEVIQIASAPVEAELTGPSFSSDGSTLFLSVQHPGEESKSREELTSHWPNGGESIPRPAVVAISGFSQD